MQLMLARDSSKLFWLIPRRYSCRLLVCDEAIGFRRTSYHVAVSCPAFNGRVLKLQATKETQVSVALWTVSKGIQILNVDD